MFKTRKPIAGLSLAMLLAAPALAADDPQATPAATIAIVPAGPETVSPRAKPAPNERPPPGRTRALQVPQVGVKPIVDGALNDEVWKRAAVADRFWISEQQRWPGEQTEVLVMADREYLYFGFRVYDSQPEGISAIQTRRGAGLGLDDQVTVELDPFVSHREISSYSVSANGVQDDAIAGGRARQLAWKGDWHAAAVRTPYGWSAEIAIPFSILNFEKGASAFAVNFVRYHHRTAEWSRWADWTVRALPEEIGRLTGVQVPVEDKSKPWTYMPYVLVGRHVPDKRGNVRDTLLNGGGEIRYQPRPNLTGVLSINPDFSQVESAITDINFNYNEKFRADPRPFFQEGSAYFGSNRGYFYSNRVPSFDYGLKFFTRAAGYQVGALGVRSPQERTDIVVRAEREIDATHSLGGLVVATDQRNLRNRLYAFRGQGREASGLNYALDAAFTTTEDNPGDGSRFAGTVGWQRDHWSISTTADRYSINYRPALGLLDRDLPDTRGVTSTVSYYRDYGEGPVREVNASLAGHARDTDEGMRQRRTWTGGGTVESRQQIRVGLFYTEGKYRPVGARPGSWANFLNDDYYWTATVDFNTRSSRIGYGGATSAGMLGGDDYEYTSGYIWVRPTPVTFVNLSSERLFNYGEFTQTIVSAGWDITPRQSLVGRYITAYYGSAFRLAYSLNVRRNIDFFLVYDRQPDVLAQLSAKVVVTFQ